MPSNPTPSFLVPATLDQLTALVRTEREIRMTIRDDLKAKRLKAMGVVAAQTQASADMFDRIIAAGEVVSKARSLAENAHMEALNQQVADLKEMAEELEQFGQAAHPLAVATEQPAAPSAGPSVAGSAALQSLQAAVPNPAPEAWKDGNAYAGTGKT